MCPIYYNKDAETLKSYYLQSEMHMAEGFHLFRRASTR